MTGTAGVVGAIAFVPIAGFFMTGTSATLPMGGGVNGFVDEDIVLAFKQAAPAPMEVLIAPVTMEVAVPAASVVQPQPTTEQEAAITAADAS